MATDRNTSHSTRHEVCALCGAPAPCEPHGMAGTAWVKAECPFCNAQHLVLIPATNPALEKARGRLAKVKELLLAWERDHAVPGDDTMTPAESALDDIGAAIGLWGADSDPEVFS